MEFVDKVGVFEWIVGFEDIRKYFGSKYTGLTKDNACMKVLEIGCGTSTLSATLLSELRFGEVVSIDNDADCVRHMQEMYKDRIELKWFVYDMIEDIGKLQGNCLDVNGYFDIVVDKGTFDAIHVEGSVSPLLEEVHRLLAVGGVYILVSINSPNYLKPLMEIEELSYSVHVEQLQLSSFRVATVVICRKLSNRAINSEVLAEKEQAISDAYFQEENPMLTPEYEAFIREMYCKRAVNGVLSLRNAHSVLFSSEHNPNADAFLSYSMDLFLEDLSEFQLATEGFMSLEEALLFIKTMQ